MALTFVDNFKMEMRKQNVERDSFDTIEAMKNYPSTSLPDIFKATNKEDGKLYIYNVSNDDDPVTGKWRQVVGQDPVNKEYLDKIGEDISGNFTYNGSPVVGDSTSEIDDTTVANDKTWSAEKISTDIETVNLKTDRINIAQKTVNIELDYLYATGNVNVTSVTTTTNLISILSNIITNNMEKDDEGFVKLLKGKKYSIQYCARQSGINVIYQIIDSNGNKYGNRALSSVQANNADCPACAIIDCKEDISIGVFTENNGSVFENSCYLSIIEISRNIIIDPVEHINAEYGMEDTPVGHILSFMGTVAPKHYLICDGSIYNITDYPYLAEYIKTQFGSYNYFGGDGTSTFAIPDLRNEFLRGYRGEAVDQSSNDIGIHQEATRLPYQYLQTDVPNSTKPEGYVHTAYFNRAASTYNDYIDKIYKTSSGARVKNAGTLYMQTIANATTSFNTRPTNVAVLFCIKYEPTYYMTVLGLEEKVVLWEGDIATVGTISLIDDYDNYDELIIIANASSDAYKQLLEFRYQTSLLIEDELYNMFIHIYDNAYKDWHMSSDKRSLVIDTSYPTSSTYIYKVIGVRSTTKQFDNRIGKLTDEQCKSLIEEVWS